MNDLSRGLAWVLPMAVFWSLPGDAVCGEPGRKAYGRSVAIVLYDGAEILDFSGPAEVFAVAGNMGSYRGESAFRVFTVASSTRPVTSQNFLKVIPDHSFDDAPQPDILVIPGGDAGALRRDPAFGPWFKGAASRAEITLTVCTGAFLPAQAGLLDGLEVTTWYGAIPALRAAAPKAVVEDGRRFVDNGSVITTAGVSAGIDGALHTVARLLGRAVADRTARYMEYHWTPEPYLTKRYSYLNPGLDDAGRVLQQGQLAEDQEGFAEAAQAYRGMLKRDPADPFVWYRLGYVLHAMGQFDEAIEAARHATSSPEWRARALYNIACGQALSGRRDEAVDSLRQAVEAGFRSRAALEDDPDLASLRESPGFRQLLKDLAAR